MTKEQASILTQNTLLPISIVGTLICTAFLVGSQYSKIEDHSKAIAISQVESKEVVITLKSMESRLIRIETKLEGLQNKN